MYMYIYINICIYIYICMYIFSKTLVNTKPEIVTSQVNRWVPYTIF